MASHEVEVIVTVQVEDDTDDDLHEGHTEAACEAVRAVLSNTCGSLTWNEYSVGLVSVDPKQ